MSPVCLDTRTAFERQWEGEKVSSQRLPYYCLSSLVKSALLNLCGSGCLSVCLSVRVCEQTLIDYTSSLHFSWLYSHRQSARSNSLAAFLLLIPIENSQSLVIWASRQIGHSFFPFPGYIGFCLKKCKKTILLIAQWVVSKKVQPRRA